MGFMSFTRPSICPKGHLWTHVFCGQHRNAWRCPQPHRWVFASLSGVRSPDPRVFSRRSLGLLRGVCSFFVSQCPARRILFGQALSTIAMPVGWRLAAFCFWCIWVGALNAKHLVFVKFRIHRSWLLSPDWPVAPSSRFVVFS